MKALTAILFLNFLFFIISKPLIIGHRGYSGKFPEHTFPSYQEAIHAKADYIEMDISPSKDHELIILHSMELSEVTNVENFAEFASRKKTLMTPAGEETGWFVQDFNLEELKRLRVKQRFPNTRSTIYDGLFQLLTFEEVLKFSNSSNVGIYVETKFPTFFRALGLPLEDKMIDLLQKYNFIDPEFNVTEKKFYIQSFESSSLRMFKSKIKDVQNVQLIFSNLNTIQNDTGRPYSEMVTPEGLDQVSTYATTIGPYKNHIGIPNSDFNSNLVQLSHERNIKVHIYTLRDDQINPDWKITPQQEFEFYFSKGVDGAFTDFPSTGIFTPFHL
jgi:glycerophosphoryl diester phosphodiesterase